MKNIKIIAFIIMIVIAFSLVGCASDNSTGEKDSQSQESAVNVEKVNEIKEKGILVLGTSTDYAPYEFKESSDAGSKIVGADIVLAESIAKDLGVDLEIKDIEFSKLEESLLNDEIDMIIASIIYNDSRKENMIASDSYYDTQMVFLINKEDEENYRTKEDFLNATIGYRKKSIENVVLKEEFKDYSKESYENSKDLVDSLISGDVQGALILKPIAEQYVKNNSNLSISDISLDYRREIVVGVKKGNDDFVEKINTTIEKLKSKGIIEESIAKYTDQWESK